MNPQFHYPLPVYNGREIGLRLTNIIIHQTQYENSDWTRAFNRFTTACELDMINAISAADIAFIMSSSQAVVNRLNALVQEL